MQFISGDTTLLLSKANNNAVIGLVNRSNARMIYVVKNSKAGCNLKTRMTEQVFPNEVIVFESNKKDFD